MGLKLLTVDMLIAMAARVRRGRHLQDPNCPEVEPLDGATSSGTSIVGGGGPLKAVGVKLALPTMSKGSEFNAYPMVRDICQPPGGTQGLFSRSCFRRGHTGKLLRNNRMKP